MAFRGAFDQAIEVNDRREQRDLQGHLARMQIKAQERMQKERLAAQQSLAEKQLAQSESQFLAQERGVQSRFDTTNDREERKFVQEQQRYDAGAEARRLTEETAKLMYAKTMHEFQEDQAQRESLTQYRRTAFGSAVLSAMMNGVVTNASLSRLNNAMGVADGDVGSVTQMWGGPDGVTYSIIGSDPATGNVGRIEQTVGPMEILTIGRGQFGEQWARDWMEMYKLKDTTNSKMNQAIQALEREVTKQQNKLELETHKARLRAELEQDKAEYRELAATIRQSPENIENLRKNIERTKSELGPLKKKKENKLTDDDKRNIETLERDLKYYENALKNSEHRAYGEERPLTKTEQTEQAHNAARENIEKATYDTVTGTLRVYYKNATEEVFRDPNKAKRMARFLLDAGIRVK
jgi:hypothetical protein